MFPLSTRTKEAIKLDLRFEQIDQMLANQTPSHIPQVITLAADKTEMQSLTRLQQAAVEVTLARLKNIERLTRSMFACVADISGDKRQDPEPDSKTTHRSGPTFDPDRFRPVVIVVATLWIGFFFVDLCRSTGRLGSRAAGGRQCAGLRAGFCHGALYQRHGLAPVVGFWRRPGRFVVFSGHAAPVEFCGAGRADFWGRLRDLLYLRERPTSHFGPPQPPELVIVVCTSQQSHLILNCQ